MTFHAAAGARMTQRYMEKKMPVVAAQRGFGASRFALELDGKFSGFATSADGGSAYGDVVEDRIATDPIVHKHLAGVKYDDITLTCGTGMERQFYDAIQAL